MRGVSCSFENAEGVKFCHECGERLQNRCPSCGGENPLPAQFCSPWGTALTLPASPTALLPPGHPPAHPAAPAPPLTERVAPEAERRHLTVRFGNLVGSTPLSEPLGPEDWRRVILASQQAGA